MQQKLVLFPNQECIIPILLPILWAASDAAEDPINQVQ